MPDSIKQITAEEILDSRGNPTLEVTVVLQNGGGAKASVPSGASTGKNEAHELRDEDKDRYGGKGVLKAKQKVEEVIAPKLIDLRVVEQNKIDSIMLELDGTDNKANLGSNATLGVSLACARAASKALGMPLYQYLGKLYGNSNFSLPTPLTNVINGGLHASTNVNIQEFWLIPTKEGSFHEKLRSVTEVFQTLGKIFKDNGLDTDLGNEGGYAPNFNSHKEILDYLLKAMTEAGYKPGEDIWLGMDVAASELYDESSGLYKLPLDKNDFKAPEFINYIEKLVKDYPILALEDPLAEEDWDNWQVLTDKLSKVNSKIEIIGDDLFCTNVKRLTKGIESKVANSILVKPNQIGTLTETLETIKKAKENKYKTAISHRSGETVDTFIADLAVAVSSEYIKTGSVARGERTAKYNRLLNIETELNGR